MNFSIDPAVSVLLPTLRLGLLVVRGADNATAHPELAALLRAEEEALRRRLGEETFKDDAAIAGWQAAHKAFGSNPNKFPPSVQALVKRVLKGGQLPSISTLVDAYNVVSLRHVVPAGGEDLAAIRGDIRLARMEGTEIFAEIGATEESHPDPGEVAYRDDLGVICRKLNWREADRTKLTPATTDCVLVIESLSDDGSLETALTDLAELVRAWTGATTEQHLLSHSAPEATLAGI